MVITFKTTFHSPNKIIPRCLKYEDHWTIFKKFNSRSGEKNGDYDRVYFWITYKKDSLDYLNLQRKMIVWLIFPIIKFNLKQTVYCPLFFLNS